MVGVQIRRDDKLSRGEGLESDVNLILMEKKRMSRKEEVWTNGKIQTKESIKKGFRGVKEENGFWEGFHFQSDF